MRETTVLAMVNTQVLSAAATSAIICFVVLEDFIRNTALNAKIRLSTFAYVRREQSKDDIGLDLHFLPVVEN